MTADQQETISRLLSQFVKLRSLHIDVSRTLAWVSVPQLQQLVCKDHVTPWDMQVFASKHPNIQKLAIVTAMQFESLQPQPQPLRFPALKHLHLGTGGSRPTKLSASLLAELAQLSTLTLQNVYISDAHLLRKLHIIRLTLMDVQLAVNEQQLPPLEEWPALKSVEFENTSSWSAVLITETLARAILPLPHPGFTVTWPGFFTFDADVPPDPQFGYMAVTHIKAVKNMHLLGLHTKAALQAMVQHRANIRELHVYDGPLSLEDEYVAACLALPSLRELRLHAMDIVMSPGVFGQLFQQCPLLDSVIVPSFCVPDDMQLPPLVNAVVGRHETIVCREYFHALERNSVGDPCCTMWLAQLGQQVKMLACVR